MLPVLLSVFFYFFAGDPKAQPYTLAVGKALAMTAIDIFTQKEVHQAIKEEFAKTKR